MCWALAGCSPGRIAAEGGTATDSGAGSSTESESGPIVETSDSDDGDDSPWGGCDGDGSGSVKWLDICEPTDPCELVDCAGGCVGGLCVEPAPPACAGLELVEIGHALDIQPDVALLRDLDGLPGDELIGIGDAVVEAVVGGELRVSDLPVFGTVRTAELLAYDVDPGLDLLIHSDPGWDGFSRILIGDGQGQFAATASALDDADLIRPFALDVDNDGDHDVLAWASNGSGSTLYANTGGMLEPVEVFAFDARAGVAVDFDLDGFVDDALVPAYPTPEVWLGEAGTLTLGDPLPPPMRGPQLEVGIGRSLVGDLDGDGFIEVVSLIVDNFSSVGVRVWWGLPGGQFEPPRDQLLFDFNYEAKYPHLFAVVELDGVAPPEIVIGHDAGFVYGRPDLDGHLAFACASTLVESTGLIHVDVGDLEADGQAEVAVAGYLEQLRLYTLAPG